MNKSLIITSLILLYCLLPIRTEAAGASFYISPSVGTFYIGSTFDVSVFLNTGGNDINAVQLDLKFDPKKVQISSPTAGKSFISVWVSQPTYSNSLGRASFKGGVPSPGIKTSSGLISTITFRAIAPGETVISILDSSRALLDDGKGTNILGSVGQGVYNIGIPPPAGPDVFSSTHPDQNTWYRNRNVNFFWEKVAGVTDFSYSIDNNFYGLPDDFSEGSNTSIAFSDLEDGIWYFHIKAKKGGNWGGITHYLVQVDSTSPADFPLIFQPTLMSTNITHQEPVVSFVTTDNLSGLDHFEIKVVNLHKTLTKKDTGFFVEVDSPYKIPTLDVGEHEVIVRAYDKAMNWKDSSQRIEVVPIDSPFYTTKRGINAWIFFLDWWRLTWLILFFIGISAIFIIYYWKKRYKNIDEKKKRIHRIKEKTRKKEEELKRKLNNK